jgi:hypothetical protein
VLVANPAALDFETNPSIALTVRVTDSGAPAFSDTANVTIQLNDLAEVVTPPPPPPPPPPEPPPEPEPEPTPDPDAGAGDGGITIGGTGGGGGGGGSAGAGPETGAPAPAPVSAAEGDEKSPSDEPEAEKPDEPVEKPTTTTLRSLGSVSTEPTTDSRTQLNSLDAAAVQANEAPVTEVEIAVAAMVSEEEGFQEELDKVQDELSELAQIEATVVGSSAVVTTGLSVGYVVWLARGGMLLASLLSSMPAWRAIDPLPVLAAFRDDDEDKDNADDESLDSLVRKGGANKEAKPAGEDAGEDTTATPDGVDPDDPLGDDATA